MNEPILLVEDDPDDVELILHHLRRGGVDEPVAVRRDGVEALDYLRRAAEQDELPGLVIADIKMPRMSGLELIRAIREAPALRHQAVALLTSSEDDDDRREAERWDPRLFLHKPREAAEFRPLVEHIRDALHDPARRR